MFDVPEDLSLWIPCIANLEVGVEHQTFDRRAVFTPGPHVDFYNQLEGFVDRVTSAIFLDAFRIDHVHKIS